MNSDNGNAHRLLRGPGHCIQEPCNPRGMWRVPVIIVPAFHPAMETHDALWTLCRARHVARPRLARVVHAIVCWTPVPTQMPTALDSALVFCTIRVVERTRRIAARRTARPSSSECRFQMSHAMRLSLVSQRTRGVGSYAPFDEAHVLDAILAGPRSGRRAPQQLAAGQRSDGLASDHRTLAQLPCS